MCTRESIDRVKIDAIISAYRSRLSSNFIPEDLTGLLVILNDHRTEQILIPLRQTLTILPAQMLVIDSDRTCSPENKLKKEMRGAYIHVSSVKQVMLNAVKVNTIESKLVQGCLIKARFPLLRGKRANICATPQHSRNSYD